MSVSEQVRGYVEKRPHIQEALSQEIVNYSALARQVQEEVDGGFEAVKMALRRYADDIQEQRERRVKNIAAILDGTSIELKSNVQVCKADEPVEGFVTAKTEHGHTAVQDADTDCPGDCIRDQVMITLKSPEDLEDTPGVLAYVLSVLAGREINLTEVVSCREDTHIVIGEADATAAFQLLNEKLG